MAIPSVLDPVAEAPFINPIYPPTDALLRRLSYTSICPPSLMYRAEISPVVIQSPETVVFPSARSLSNTMSPVNRTVAELTCTPSTVSKIRDEDVPLLTSREMESTFCSMDEMSPLSPWIWDVRLLAVCSRLEISPLIPVICVVILPTVCWMDEIWLPCPCTVLVMESSWMSILADSSWMSLETSSRISSAVLEIRLLVSAI